MELNVEQKGQKTPGAGDPPVKPNDKQNLRLQPHPVAYLHAVSKLMYKDISSSFRMFSIVL